MDQQAPKELPKKRMSLQVFAGQDKEKITAYLYIIFTLAAVSFFGFFALRPAVSTISNLQKQLEDSRQVSTALQTKLDALSKLDREYQQLEGRLNVVYEAIPTSSQIPQLTRQIENITKQNNATLNTFSLGSFEYYPAGDGKTFYTYTFSMDVQGSEQDIDNLISEIISFNRLLSIDRITTGNSQNNTVSASIAGKAYFAEK